MPRISIAGLTVDTDSTDKVFENVRQRLRERKKTFMVTPYSEFLFAGMKDPQVMALLNSSDISIPDGIAIVLARTFLEKPLKFKNIFLRKLQGWWQMFWLGTALLFNRKKVYGPFASKIVGADFVWKIAKAAELENRSIYILGGFGDTPRVATEKLKEKFPDLQIAGFSNKSKSDPSLISDIQSAKPDILLVGFGPIIQEKWIKDNWENLPVLLAVGLGGTFDYLAGAKSAPPRWIRQIGLEWLYRLFTQPSRAGRIKNATFGLVKTLINYKASV